MKGKKILALASIFAGVALVGSTFAAWAVTDNADPFSVKVSPGTIQSDDETDFVTLSYGQQSYANVGSIVSGTKRLAAMVELKASWTNPNKTTFGGLFKVGLTQTDGGANKLIDHLNVYVYNTNQGLTIDNGLVTAVPTGDGVLVGSVLTNTTGHAADLPVSVAYNAGVGTQTVYVVVEYETITDASIISSMASDVVTLTMNWDEPATGTVSSNSHIVYYAGNETNPHVYAWSKTNNVVTAENKPYPGVAMTKVRDGLYSYVLLDSYQEFLLVSVGESNVKITANDVNASTWRTNYSAITQCYLDNTDVWGKIPEEVTSLTKEYYLVGTFNNWTSSDTYGLESAGTDHYRITGVTMAIGDKFKIVSRDGKDWYTDSSIWTEISGLVELEQYTNNMVVKTAGSYTIEFYLDSNNPIVPSIPSNQD